MAGTKPQAPEAVAGNEAGKPVRRKRRSSEEINNRLIAAAQAEFKRLGYAGATTAAIARAAETTEAQLFRSFASKAALFQEAVFRPLSAHLEQFNRDHLISADAAHRADNARLYIAELQRFVADNARLLHAALLTGSHEGSGIPPIESLTRYFDRGAAVQSERIDGPPRVDPRLMVRVSFAAVLANMMFRDWLFPDDLKDDAAINAAVANFVLDGINANGPIHPHD
ncbi:TetR family transcriptional regulator [Sphingobium sp. AP49]|uniref:TetR family transcriptional regulator n=1 Tax=Sphingobium sp. AP49 TaxID=1144307 RepID=UPI00026EE391|nr:TetR family transcriptional regulator [Sphingobium sp. AP49]WHO41035.1 TetR family transcriptional regulator [Sphingobium sp. AP49]